MQRLEILSADNDSRQQANKKKMSGVRFFEYGGR